MDSGGCGGSGGLMQTDHESGASGAPWPIPTSSELRCCGASAGSALASYAHFLTWTGRMGSDCMGFRVRGSWVQTLIGPPLTLCLSELRVFQLEKWA